MPICLFRNATAAGMTQAGNEYPDKATVPWELYRRPTFAILSAEAARNETQSLTA